MSPLATQAAQSAYQLVWVRRRRQEWLAANGPCVQCGSWERLEVDHIDRSTKLSHRIWSWCKEKLDLELAKCQVLCRNCHIAKTAAENRRPIPHGTHSGYANHRCRCVACTEAQRSYCANIRLQRAEQIHLSPETTAELERAVREEQRQFAFRRGY